MKRYHYLIYNPTLIMRYNFIIKYELKTVSILGGDAENNGNINPNFLKTAPE